jgi:adenosylhomocysteine nucleosidase
MSRSITLVLGAVPWEIKPIETVLNRHTSHLLYDFPYFEGTIGKQNLIIAITGVGKTNAAMITSLFVQKFRPTRLLFTGTAARINRELRTGDIILGKKTVHHDAGTLKQSGMLYRKIIGPIPKRQTHFQYSADSQLLASAIEAAKSYDPRKISANDESYLPAVKPGIICSGDLFGMTEIKLDDIRQKLRADLVEMEGSAVAQVCHSLHVPHLVIRGGSNLAQENPGGDYKRLGQIAARSAALFTVHLIQHLS